METDSSDFSESDEWEADRGNLMQAAGADNKTNILDIIGLDLARKIIKQHVHAYLKSRAKQEKPDVGAHQQQQQQQPSKLQPYSREEDMKLLRQVVNNFHTGKTISGLWKCRAGLIEGRTTHSMSRRAKLLIRDVSPGFLVKLGLTEGQATLLKTFCARGSN